MPWMLLRGSKPTLTGHSASLEMGKSEAGPTFFTTLARSGPLVHSAAYRGGDLDTPVALERSQRQPASRGLIGAINWGEDPDYSPPQVVPGHAAGLRPHLPGAVPP